MAEQDSHTGVVSPTTALHPGAAQESTFGDAINLFRVIDKDR